MNYETAKKYTLTFLIFYALIGYAGHVTRDGTEDVYPFFSWSLFARIPERVQDDFEVVVLSAGGKRLESPTEAREVAHLVDKTVNYQIYTQRVREFGRALSVGGDSSRERESFEGMLTAPATYEVHAVQYNPIDRFLTGKADASSTMGTFTTGTI